MTTTKINGKSQVADNSIGRDQLNVATSGKAVIRKIIAGTGIAIVSTGGDSGTGDVTIRATGGGTGTGGGEDMIGFSVNSLNNIKSGVKAYRTIPFDCVVTDWFIDTNAPGNIQVNLELGIVTPSPIVGTGTKPFLSNQTHNTSAPIGWTLDTFTKGDVIIFSVEPGADINDVIFSLAILAL